MQNVERIRKNVSIQARVTLIPNAARRAPQRLLLLNIALIASQLAHTTMRKPCFLQIIIIKSNWPLFALVVYLSMRIFRRIFPPSPITVIVRVVACTLIVIVTNITLVSICAIVINVNGIHVSEYRVARAYDQAY